MATLKERRLADKKRRQRWLQRQKDKGNKAFTIMLTPAMQKILAEKTKETGQSKSEIVGQAILNLRHSVTPDKILRAERPPEQRKIIQRIRELQNEGISQERIAEILNSMGIKPFTGRGRWLPATIRNLLSAKDKAE